MSSRAKSFWLAVLFLFAVGFLVFVWPTRYRFDHTNVEGRRLPVRIDRLTGDAEVLEKEGWVSPEKVEPAKEPPKRRVREMEDCSEITGRGGLEETYGGDGEWSASLYNGSEWDLTEITVKLWYRGLTREYRIPCYICAKSSGTCTAPVDSDVMLKWRSNHHQHPDWDIVGARGYPPPGYRTVRQRAEDLADLVLAPEDAQRKRQLGRHGARARRTAIAFGASAAILVILTGGAVLLRRRRKMRLASDERSSGDVRAVHDDRNARDDSG